MKRWLPILVFVLAGETLLGGTTFALTTSDRIQVLTNIHGYYPCMDCHGDQTTVTTPRIMEEEHAEPLVWTDADGIDHSLSFGERISIGELLSSTKPGDRRSDKVARVGNSIGIRNFMEFNGLSAEDSVWAMLHGGGNIWCLNCHDDEDRNKLVKLNGETITFNESHLLCGECHGSILTDWDLGIHGKTTGYWDPDADTENSSRRLLCVECHNPHAPAFAPMKALPPPVPRLPRRDDQLNGHLTPVGSHE